MNRPYRAQIYLLVGGLLLLLVLLSAFLGMAVRQERLILSQLNSSAQALFKNIVLTRRWNANHGGVYVLKGLGVESNPYLKDPDLRAVGGRTYTKKNPALMTREISEYAQAEGAFTYHITSLNLLNPSNAPDPWEREALSSFEQGVTESARVSVLDNKKVYRFMRPLHYEKGCVACHEHQGYELGDVRGGISVTLPFEQTAVQMSSNRAALMILAAAVTGVLGMVLYFFVWRMMSRLFRQNQQLLDLNCQKDRFLGMAAHDLRNPLGAIEGFSRIITAGVAGPVNPEQQKLLGRIERTSGTMLQLVDDLLDVSKIHAGRLDLNIEDTVLRTILRDVFELNEIAAKGKRIELKLDLSADLPHAGTDPDRLGQVVDNLLNNAIKFSRAGSTVTLRGRSPDGPASDKVEIAVIDEGPGIPADELPRLFESFQRTSVTPTGGEGSTGLGLAIVKRIVDAHGGTIAVDSQVGIGSTFTVTLAAAPRD
ncbi:ATP-binding protein [Planctomycetota bacterium]